MMVKIAQHNGYDFVMADKFESRFLSPIIANLQVKAQEGWDDYNEVYHCTQLIETVNRIPGITMDFHFMEQEGICHGIALVSFGEIARELFFSSPELIENEATVVLNYFHIDPNSRGQGAWWLEKIMNHYHRAGFKTLMVKSSHPQAFTLYQRWGEAIGSYQSPSDNGLYWRQGKIFKIEL